MNRKIAVLILACALAFQACKTEEKEPEIPDFSQQIPAPKAIDKIDFTSPKEAEVKAGSVTQSETATAVTGALVEGRITEEVLEVTDAISESVPADKAKALASAVTEDLLRKVSAGENLPESVLAQINDLKSNPALATFVPELKYPEVEGESIQAFVEAPEIKLDLSGARLAQIQSQCTDEVTTAYNNAIKTINSSKDSLDAVIKSTYETKLAEVAAKDCGTATPSPGSPIFNQFGLMANDLRAVFILTGERVDSGSLATIKSAKMANDDIDEATKQAIRTLASFNYFANVDATLKLYTAEYNACNVAKTYNQNYLKLARANDLAELQKVYEAGIKPAKDAAQAAMQYCHDQGMGGN